MIRERDLTKNRGILGNMNFEYFFGCKIKAEEFRPCQSGSHCCDNDYCRCTEITDAWVEEAPDISSIVKHYATTYNKNCKRQKLKKLTEEIDLYGLDRLFTIHKLWEPSSYEVAVSGGYYGEELRGVFMVNSVETKLVIQIEQFLKLKTNKAKVEFLLNAEYGHLLKSVKDKKWTIKTVKCEDIVFGAESYHKDVVEVDRYKDYNLPRGICLSEYTRSAIAARSSRKYRVIDGYHRLSSLVKSGETTTKIIVGR